MAKITWLLCAGLRELRLVLPRTNTLERLALKGRVEARRQAASSIIEALSKEHRMELQNLLINDPGIGQSRLIWLRGYPHSTSPDSMHALLARIRYLRELGLPSDLGHDIHPARFAKFAKQGAVAPLSNTSPLGREHIVLKGDNDWHSGAAERKIARLLHLNASRKWVG